MRPAQGAQRPDQIQSPFGGTTAPEKDPKLLIFVSKWDQPLRYVPLLPYLAYLARNAPVGVTGTVHK